MTNSFRVVVLLILGGLANGVSAGVVFYDDFSGDAAGTTSLALTNWQVFGGNVDILAAGHPLCSGGTGNCIDLEGTGSFGYSALSDIAMTQFLTAGDYEFEFRYGNNTNLDNTLTFFAHDNVLSYFNSTLSTGGLNSLVTNVTAFSLAFDSNVTFKFSANDSNFLDFDNSGPILDYVKISTANPVPGPSTLVVFALGIASLVLRRFRTQ